MKKNKKIIVLTIVLIIVLAIGIIIKINSSNESKENETNEIDTNIEGEPKTINFYEDFSTIGTIQNLDRAQWNSARITQLDNKMQVEITIINILEYEKVDATNLTINLLDKAGNIILTKDAEMEEIPENFGQTTLNLEFDIEDFVIVYDIQIIANK